MSLGWAKRALREMIVTAEIGKGDLDSESNDSKIKRKGDGEKLFELKAGSGKDDGSPAKNLRKGMLSLLQWRRGNEGSRRWCSSRNIFHLWKQ